MKCKQCQRLDAAPGDEFCSTRCAKINFGVISPEEAKRGKATRRKILAEEKAGKVPFVELENPHRNRDRHEGPTPRQRTRRVG